MGLQGGECKQAKTRPEHLSCLEVVPFHLDEKYLPDVGSVANCHESTVCVFSISGVDELLCLLI